MSDMYSIPKTCTRTCSIFRNIHTMVRSFLKIDVGSEWESHGGPLQSRPSTCGLSVVGAEMRVDIDSIVERTVGILRIDSRR